MIPILFDCSGRPFCLRVIRAGHDYHEGCHEEAEPLVIVYEDMPLVKPREVIPASYFLANTVSFHAVDFDESALEQIRRWLRYELVLPRIALDRLREYLRMALERPDGQRETIDAMRGLDFDSPALQRACGGPNDAERWLRVYQRELTVLALIDEGAAPCSC
jgi:hypothetical protein